MREERKLHSQRKQFRRINDGYATSFFTQFAMSHDYYIEPMRELVGRIHRHGAKLRTEATEKAITELEPYAFNEKGDLF